MKVKANSDGTFAITGLSGEELRAVGALADFPLWSVQPAPIANVCSALHAEIQSVPPGDGASAEAYGMVPVTTLS